MPWPDQLPDVAALVTHVGVVRRWVASILETGETADEERFTPAPDTDLPAWSAAGAALLTDTLAAVPADRPCWIIGGRRGTATHWRRRMVFEHTKHLLDLRAAGGGAWRAAPELTPEDAADGVDELFSAFLWRSLPRLEPLPDVIVLRATDVDRAWRIDTRWGVTEACGDAEAGATLSATAGDLALVVWERADPFDPTRFRIDGDGAVVTAFRAAPIHPW